ncbi:molybdopterin oxidoreductase [Leucothrix pacifica]|uniref:Molybdopterin oxidoreductase n=2 Tax=Leucothrix pacifica TaxID=1247513 RepID=A0A317C8Z9_9GAMM|nr:molybdopterin oxidoreductase [Leucothrix pacifica]
MNNQVVWGMPHVFAIFLIVAASGAANIGSLGTVFNKKIYQPLGRLSLIVAVSLLLGGLAVLVLDLGHADRLIIAMTYYNFKSIFAWNILLYNGFLVIMGIYLWSMMDRRKMAKAAYKPAGYVGFVWRFILTTGTGSIFGFLVARQYYDAAILAPLFIAASYVFGTAVFTLVLIALYKLTNRELGNEIQNRLRYTLAIFIALVLFFEIVRHVSNLYATEHHGVEAYILTGGDKITWLFWLGQVILGSLLPLLLIWLPSLKNNQLALLSAAGLAIFGGISQLYVIIVGGQLYPLVLFPNAEVESSYYDGSSTSYSASLPEFALGLGGVALSLALVVVAVKALRLLPETLADAAVADE